MKHKTHNLLVILGHPSTKSLSHKLAASYIAGARSEGINVEVIDTYRLDPELPFVDYEDYPDWDRDAGVRQHYQAMITKADKIAIFHPIWWGGLPPKLKNFLDQTLTPGFAYKYTFKAWVPNAFRIKPTGYLKGKKAHIFITYDAYTFVYLGLLFPFITIWAVFILFFCGITNMKFTLHQRVRWTGEATREKWLKRAKKRGTQV